ncbi:MAG: DUF3108 domain-containing protein [Nitrospirae bacterium]|nr:DUF3108 domain-containing protein [Nitrospirota bacterium]
MKKIFTPIVISLALSMVLHAVFIAVASGIGVFDFVRGFTDRPLTALLISEGTSRPNVTYKTKSPRAATPESLSSAGSDKAGTPKNETAVQENAVHSEEATSVQQVPGAPDKSSSDAPKVTDPSGSPAQDAPALSATAVPPAAAPEIRAGLLKSSREKLSFSIYWFGIYVGNAELEAVSSEGKVTIKSQVHSAPVISTFYTVEDYSESKVINGLPVNFKIKQHEGKYRSDKETIFDLDNRHVTFLNNLKGTKDDFTVNGGGLWDLISGFYYLRTQDFEVGKTIYIDIFDSKKFFKAEVNVIGKERIRFSKNVELDTVKVKPLLKSEGLFQNKGDILIWLTDDESKTPVRIETKVPIGTVVAELTSAETEE